MEETEVDWLGMADEYTNRPYYADSWNKARNKRTDLCPLCKAPKVECYRTEGIDEA